MSREIGSDFNSIQIKKISKNNIFNYLSDYHSMFFDSGRSALRYLLKRITGKTVLLPSYICESVKSCFCGWNIEYYEINKELEVCLDDLICKISNNVDVIYIHYFNGIILDENSLNKLRALKNIYRFTVIEDTTHSLLTEKNSIGDYCISSLRKWFPIPDGGVLYSLQIFDNNEHLKENYWHMQKYQAMREKTEYLSGTVDSKDNLLELFCKSECELDRQNDIFRMSDISMEILSCIDMNTITEIRLRNYYTLLSDLSSTSIRPVPNIAPNQVPLFFTILVDNRNQLRNWLIENRIYCPIHWPLFQEIKGLFSNKWIFEKELSIPIDQRYDTDDMHFIAKKIKEYEDKNDRINKI